eukprot:TRINITY_DN48406_c0_g1_i1.p1 TRINITY_DN48406_c0_g1~~TRINITY_DN48406_c0_g1_i1.p1  ORF type:complete len:219 (-),score=12.56 TRINITY_DN48406_c0_g1_i1:115-744(-)
MPDTCAHVGFGFLAARLLNLITPWDTPCHEGLAIDALIAVASNLPDFLDKPLFLCKCTCGTRSYGHTVLFLILATVACAILPFNQFQAAAWFGVCDWFGIARVVFVAVSSHLLADTCFGYVPLFWPLPGWAFRAESLDSEEERARAKRWKPWLDATSIVYVTVGTSMPQHVGGWTNYFVVLLAFVILSKLAVTIVKAHRRRSKDPCCRK